MQGTRDLERLAHEKESENCELKLEILRWRKRAAVLRLKQSSLAETVAHMQVRSGGGGGEGGDRPETEAVIA